MLILTSFVVGFFLNLCEITAEASILTLLPASGALAVNIIAGFCGLAINHLLNVVISLPQKAIVEPGEPPTIRGVA